MHKRELNTAALEVAGISKRFGEARRAHRLMPWRKEKKQKLALDQVSLHVQTGRITGILGASGSGKSTLIRDPRDVADARCGERIGLRLRRRVASRRRAPPHQPRLGRGLVLQRDEPLGEHALRGAPLWQWRWKERGPGGGKCGAATACRPTPW